MDLGGGYSHVLGLFMNKGLKTLRDGATVEAGN